MKLRALLILALGCLAACAGTPVPLGTRSDAPVPQGPARTITARGCGFQLLLLVPIAVNTRQQRAYADLLEEARGDFITDVQVQERWTYAFVGTSYCTLLEAKAIKTASSGS